MKIKKALKSKKGFTITECIVAIAVFGIMSTMIMQILALSIAKHRSNHHIEKDIDAQIENIINSNNIVERETTTLALNFLGGTTVNINGVEIQKDNGAAGSDRLEINTLHSNITVAPDGGVGGDDDGGGAAMMTDSVHLYGAKELDNIILDTSVADTADGNKKVTFILTVNDTKQILCASDVNGFKVILPNYSKKINTDLNGEPLRVDLLNSSTLRFCCTSDKANKTVYDGVKITFELTPEEFENEYKDAKHYFGANQPNGGTFTDADTPGIFDHCN